MENNLIVNGLKDGVNRAKVWQLIFFAANNGAVVIAFTLIIAKYYLYFTTLALGLAPLIICVLIMATRLIDSFLSPVIGSLMERTDTRIGKFRPYLIAGGLLTVGSFMLIFFCPDNISNIGKYIYVSGFSMVFAVGYTMLSAVTKCGLAIMTNDPKQRALYGTFDSVMQGLGGALLPFIAGTVLYKKYGYADPAMWRIVAVLFGAISLGLTGLAIIGIKGKDIKAIYGVGNTEKVKFADFFKLLKENKALKALIISASTDKLAYSTRSLTSAFFFIAILSRGDLDGMTMIFAGAPSFFLLMFAFAKSSKAGMKKILVISSWAAGILAIITIAAVPFIAPPGVAVSSAAAGIVMALYCLQYMASFVSSAVVQPMISDCTDYEFYTTGRFIPGMVGNTFALIDKIMSAFAGLVLGFAMLISGYGFQLNLDEQATDAAANAVGDPKFYWAMLFCVFFLPFLAHLATVIAMKWYPIDVKLNKEIQEFIAKERNKENATA